MLKMKIHNQCVKVKIDNKTSGIDVVVGICRLYVALMENGFKKKEIDTQVNEVLKGMKELDKQREESEK